MQSSFIKTNEIVLHYLDYGGEGENILLLHGLTANAHAFDGLIEAGLSNHFRVISVDLRGRGLSDHPVAGYDMQSHAADIIGLLEALNIESVHICGHSFGGFLGLYLAIYFSKKVKRLILLDAAVRMHPQTKEMLGPALSRLGQRFESFENYIEIVKKAPYLHFWEEKMLSYYRADVKTNEDGTVTPRSTLDNMMEAVLKGSLGEPWAELIELNHKPTILINAPGVYTMGNALLPKDFAMETVEMMRDCSYVEVEGNHQTMLYGLGAKQIVKTIQEFILK
ncbi:MAG: alpha/beta hydrolase [Sediminibacterium sp.]|nr:alpha/beta hydrolase [Sediminibacterium sp.]